MIEERPHNPSSNPAKYKKNKWMIIAISILLFTGITVGVVVSLTKNKEELEPILYVYSSAKDSNRLFAY